MKYVCKKKCFYRSKLWHPAETLDAEVGEAVPHHFKQVEQFDSAQGEPEKPPFFPPSESEEEAAVDREIPSEPEQVVMVKSKPEPKKNGRAKRNE